MKRHWFSTLLAAAAALSPLFAASVPEGESRKLLDSRTELLSARLLFNEALARWLAAPLPGAEELLAAWMKENAKECAVRAAAERLMRPRYLGLLQQGFSQMAAATLEPFRKTIPDAALNAISAAPDALLAEKCNREFPAAFDAARKKLVAEQRAEITVSIYPGEAELEQDDDKVLAAKLAARFAERRGAPLWEELLPQLQSELIAPVLRSARDQQQRQLTLAGQLTPDARLWDQKAAAADLEKQLNAEIAAWKAEKRYALFPRTLELIQKRSARLPQERVIALLPKLPATPDYATLLDDDPEANADPEASFRRYAARIAESGLDAAQKQLSLPEAYRAGIADDAEVKQALERRFQALKPELQKLRNAFAGRQFKKRFPSVADRSFLPEPDAIEVYRRDKGQMTFPDGADDPELLAETRQLLKAGVAERYAAGNAELSDQLNTVEKEYDTVVAEMEKLHGKISPSWPASWFGAKGGIDLDTIKDCYTERVLERFLAGGNRGYPDLFPQTEEEIDLRTRAILQRLTNPAPPPPKPQASQQKTAELTLVYRVLVDTENDQLVARLKERRFTASLNPARREAEEKRLIAEVAKELDALCRTETQTALAPPKFVIRIEVGGGSVYYRFVAELRDKLRMTLRQNGTTVEDSLGGSTP